MEARAHAVLDAAHAAGVRYFDAARSYGRAEAFLSSWLASRGIRPGEVTVGSKWGYRYTADWQVESASHEVKDLSADHLRTQAAESRALLGPYIGLYQIHSATLESGVLEDAAVLEGLRRLKDQGWKIGLSVSGPKQAETVGRALEVAAPGGRLFDCVQATWNVLELSAGAVLAEAHALGLGVIVKEALANGRLTPRNEDPGFAPSRRLLGREATRLGTTLDAFALAAALSRPWIDVALSGASTEGQLRSNLAAIDVAWDLEAEEAIRPLAEDPLEYWAIRGRLPWN
jgi:aryl-alcohol dehydrogenase-like predicted oxidoreductase